MTHQVSERLARYPYLTQAKEALDKGKLSIAFNHFQMAFRIDKKSYLESVYLLYQNYNLHRNIHTLILLADFYLDCGYKKECLKELEDAFELDPQLEHIYISLSKYFSKDKNEAKVIDLCENALSKNIYFPSLIDILSNHYFHNKLYLKNIKLYQKLILHKPKHFHYRLRLIELHLGNNELDPALNQLEELYQNNPNRYEEILNLTNKLLQKSGYHAKALLLQTRLHLEHLDPKTSFQAIKKLLKIKRELPSLSELLDKHLQKIDSNSSLFLFAAESDLHQENYDKAVKALNTIFAQDKTLSKSIFELTEKVLNKKPSLTGAILLKVDLSVYFKDFSNVFNTLEKLFIEEESAAEACEKRLITYSQTQPHLVKKIQKTLAYCYLTQKHYQKCLNLCDVILNENYCSKCKAIQIQALIGLEKYAHAITSYQQLIAKNDLTHLFLQTRSKLKTSFLKNKGKSLGKSSNLLEGIEQLCRHQALKALKLFQNIQPEEIEYPLAQALCGRCFVEIGRFDMANDLFNFVIKKFPDQSQPYQKALLYWMGLNHLNQGQISLTIHYIQEIYKLDMSYLNMDQKLKLYQQKTQLDLRGKALALVLLDPSKNDLIAINCTNPENLKNDAYSQGFQAISFAQNHNNDGVKHILQKNISTAETAFHLAFQLDPNLPSVATNTCIAHLLSKEKYSKSPVENLIHNQAKFPIAQLVIAIHFILQNDLAQAQKWAEKALKKTSTECIAALILGDIAFRNNEARLAGHYWAQASKEDALFFLLKKREYAFRESLLSVEYWLSDFSLDWS